MCKAKWIELKRLKTKEGGIMCETQMGTSMNGVLFFSTKQRHLKDKTRNCAKRKNRKSAHTLLSLISKD
jgi:hypothetical protein